MEQKEYSTRYEIFTVLSWHRGGGILEPYSIFSLSWKPEGSQTRSSDLLKSSMTVFDCKFCGIKVTAVTMDYQGIWGRFILHQIRVLELFFTKPQENLAGDMSFLNSDRANYHNSQNISLFKRNSYDFSNTHVSASYGAFFRARIPSTIVKIDGKFIHLIFASQNKMEKKKLSWSIWQFNPPSGKSEMFQSWAFSFQFTTEFFFKFSCYCLY